MFKQIFLETIWIDFLRCKELIGRLLPFQKIWITFLFLFSISICVSAQQNSTKEKLEKELEQASQLVYSDNPEKAIPILNRIKKEAESSGNKSIIPRIGYTFAIIYFNGSDYDKVINLNEDFLKVGHETKDFENISHIYRLKGSAYSELGLLSKGNEEFEEAIAFAEKIQPGNNRQYALSLIYSNLASHQMKGGVSHDSILITVKNCIAEAEKMGESDSSIASKKYSMIAYSYIIMANLYDKDGKAELAEEYYLKALQIHKTQSVPLVEKVVLLNQLGYFYYDKKKYEESIKFAEEGLSTEKKASLPQLRTELFKVLSQSYLELQETEQSKKYLHLFTALNDSILNVNKKAVDAAVNKTLTNQKELRENNRTKQLLIYTLSAAVFIIFGVFVFLYYRKQKQIKRIEKTLEKLKAGQTLSEPVASVEMTSNLEPEKEEKIALMSPEAENKLVEKLRDFEQSNLFLERKVSLPYVAAEIETNTKYLSYIIKKHKGKDFNEYINDLRITYIVQKITDEPIYRQYKINTLAEETGFSSHSKFATVFKAVVGVSPSEFIKYIQQK